MQQDDQDMQEAPMTRDLRKPNQMCCWKNCPRKACNPKKHKSARISTKRIRENGGKTQFRFLIRSLTEYGYQDDIDQYYVACSSKDHTADKFFKAKGDRHRTVEDKTVGKVRKQLCLL